jgi:hypothetical protein
MSRLWKNFRTNFMYWRFRYITRNRLRLQSWWSRRRSMTAPTGYRPRATAGRVYRSTGRRTWIALVVLVGALTALRVWASYVFINPAILYLIGTLLVIGVIYWTLRGV